MTERHRDTDADHRADRLDPIEEGSGSPTEARLFFGLGAFSLLLGIVYIGWTSREPGGIEWAGGAALLFASGFSLFFGTWLAISLRRVQHDVLVMEDNLDAGDTDTNETLYLPDTSIWPIGLGVGVSLIAAGLALGAWVLIPGIALFVQSLIGFAHQSRRRG